MSKVEVGRITKLKKAGTQAFPCRDNVRADELEALGLIDVKPSIANRRIVKAVWTGEKRPPKKGEWYLSGAIIEAYRAKNDLSDTYPIATLVTIEKHPATYSIKSRI